MAANPLRRASFPELPSPTTVKPPTTPTALTPSEFHHTIAKLAVAQILRSTGFKHSKSSALNTLARITTLFLQSLATHAANHAAFSCNRTQCNIFDLIHAIEHLSLSFGFPGASGINQPLLGSKTLNHLRYFIDAIDENPPFRRRIPRRGISSDSSVFFSGNVDFSKGKCRGPEIPRWLPEFPVVESVDDGGVNSGNKEVLWEDRRFEFRPLMAAKVGKSNKEFVLQGRRERVKFRLGGKRRNVKVGGLDDLELRNGVCRGGKRVCLIKRVGNNCRIFDDEDDDDEKGFNIGL
ncbi:uncharacterized protein LOC110725976 [Chenopodium quinoa]|uniref:uncharacterized protein LOC110725976 n=1 Tax=Chenopodium quinoa TaxID=63459 RepID=UPI000B76DA55|nr:uncharacterized protein LOC110725976 [Chenopodium quinoa]